MALSSRNLKFIGLVVFVMVGVLVFQVTGLGEYVHPEKIRSLILSAGPLAPVLYVVIYSLAPVLFAPGWILTIAGGLAFGPVWGTILTVAGATIGATLAFLVARTMGREFVARLFKGKFKALDEKSGDHGFQIIFSLRLIPVVPFNALNYVAGISNVKSKDYILGTFLGIIPGTFVYVYLGDSLANVYSWQFLGAIGLLVLLSLIPLFYKRWKKKADTTPAD